MLIKCEEKSNRGVRELILPTFVSAQKQVAQREASASRVNTLTMELAAALKTAQLSMQKVTDLEHRLKKEQEKQFQQGFEKGQEEGYRNGVDEIKVQLDHFSELIGTLQNQQGELVKNASHFVMEFIFKSIHKILGEPELLRIQPRLEKITETLSEAMSEFVESSHFVLRVNRQTVELLDQNREKLDAILPTGNKVRVKEDSTLQVGECLIECDYGILDARFEAQIRKLQTSVMADNENE